MKTHLYKREVSKNTSVLFRRMIMKFLLLFIISVCLSSVVSANEKTTLIIGHVITQTIQGNDVDHSELLTNELKLLTHHFAHSLVESLSNHLPIILDGVSATIRLEVDDLYKCSLQDDYKNKDCR